MFRLPASLLGHDIAQRYCRGESAQVWAAGDDAVVDLVSEGEDGDWDSDGEGLLAGIVPACAELAAGDLRVLRLAWLACTQAGEFDADESEPSVPPGLAALSAAQASLADFLRIDDGLRTVAAAASPPSAVDGPSAAALVRWIDARPAAERTPRYCACFAMTTRTFVRSCCGASSGNRPAEIRHPEVVLPVSFSTRQRSVAPNDTGGPNDGGPPNRPGSNARWRRPASDACRPWPSGRRRRGSGWTD